MALDPRGFGLVRHDVANGRDDLRHGIVGAVGLEDPGLRFHDLREAPERRSLPVRKGATLSPHDELGILVDDAEELADEPRLPDPGHADHRHDLRFDPCSRPRERADEDVPLVVPSDERRPGVGEVDAIARSAPNRTPDGEGVCLPLCDDGRRRLELNGALGRAVRVLTHEDPAGGRSRLESRTGVHDVAGDHGLAELRARIERDDRLSRVYTDPNLQRERRIGLVHLRDRLLDRQRCADRSLGIVLVGDGGPEDADNGVADELLDRAAVAFEFGT